MRSVRVLFVATVASLLAACALQPIPYDKTAAGEIKTIGIVTPAVSETPVVILATSVGQSFGLIGALVDASMQENRQTKFKAAIEPHGFSAMDICVQEVTTALQEHGYSVVMVPAQRSGTEFLPSYASEEEAHEVDAYLDMVISYGYIAAGVMGRTPYRPIVYVTARLTRASDSKVLMQEAVSYNPVGPFAKNSKSVTIPPHPEFQFSNFDALVGDPATAVKGMQTSLVTSVKPISENLK